MRDDEHVCLCFGVSKRKIVNYNRRERPAVVSRIYQALPAGTGWQWRVPFVKSLHRQVKAGKADPDLPFTPAAYAKQESAWRKPVRR